MGSSWESEGRRSPHSTWEECKEISSVAMQQWNVEHHVYAVKQFFRNNDSVVTVQRFFCWQFNVVCDGAIPDRNTILRWVESFHTNGSVMKRTSTGHLRMAQTPENDKSVRMSVIESPRRSTRRHASILGLSRRSLQRILHGELNFHPYKIMIVQRLLPSDSVQCRLFCERMLEIIASDDVILLMNDEVHFHLDGYVNNQNCRFWAAENLWELHQRPSILLRFQFGAAFRKWRSLVLTFLKKRGLQ